MNILYNYIEARIKSRIPEIKTVALWNSQFANANGTEKETRQVRAFRYPACFIEFEVEETINRCLGIKDYKMKVRFRFGINSFKFVKLDTFDFCDKFDSEMQLMAATKNSETIIFNTFQENMPDFDEDHNNVDTPVKEYRTLFRSLAAYKRNKLKQQMVTAVDVTTEIVPTVDQL